MADLLERHRRDIEALDRRILHLVCERLELAREIGELKRSRGIPLRNFEVETEIRRRFEGASRFLGHDPDLGRDLALFLIRKSVEVQASQRDSAYEGDALDSLVVGGKGGMGRWFGRFLQGQGHGVRVFDPAPGPSPFPEARSLAEGVRGADLILVAVPMSDCRGVLEELASLGTRGVVAEMCSLKGHMLEAMERLRRGGLRLVSFHPLFGPDVKMLSGRTILFCREGDPGDRERVRRLFAGTSARLVEMDAGEHDRRMGIVLGLTHLSNLVFGRALAHSRIRAEELVEVAGVTFHKQLATTREVAGENPELYFQIQALNACTSETAAWLRLALDEWSAAVEAGDPEAFTRLMEGCREYLSGTERRARRR